MFNRKLILSSILGAGFCLATSALAQNWVGVAYSAQQIPNQKSPTDLNFIFSVPGKGSVTNPAATTDNLIQSTVMLDGQDSVPVSVQSADGKTLAQGVITKEGIQCIMTNAKGSNPLQGVIVNYVPGNAKLNISYQYECAG